MRRRAWLVGLVVALPVAGCAGPRATSFGSLSKPLAQRMQTALSEKDLATAQKILKLATQRAEGKKKTVKSNELKVLQQCVEMAEKDEWEGANELIDKSLAFE